METTEMTALDEAPARSNADDTLIVEIRKNARETFRITVGSYKGHPYIGVRIWVPGDGDTLIPTKKGITVAPDKAPELIAALGHALQAINGEGSE